jgi:hypothetical protein
MKLTIDVDDEFFRQIARAIMDADITRGTAVPPAPAPVPEPAPAPVPPVNPPVTPPNPPEPAPPVVITRGGGRSARHRSGVTTCSLRLLVDVALLSAS